MSKINKIRFVNLNYNNNTMKIDDETFYLDGESTMLNLRNGGGKSVIVQMVMAPFVNRRHRTLKDRSFDSYFTSPTPTYIMVEWKLDDGAGYLLTGMMVRKKDTSSDENSKEKLDVINFTHEYRRKNDFDIDSISIIEEKNNARVIKSFANSKKLFEDLKKDRELKFNYYDMNNSVATRNYFTKLSEYKINYKEWETIIKQINLKESGLSELFTKSKDSAGLVKEWFLPAIENKLNKEEDRIKNYVELVNSYILQYKDNKSKIDRKEKIELFEQLAIELSDEVNNFIDVTDKRIAIENTIANIINYLKVNYTAKIKEEETLDNLITSLNEEINELNYEKESITIFKKEEEKRCFEESHEKYTTLLKESEENKEELIRKANILECAKIHRDYQSSSKDLQQLETELRIVNDKNKDNAPKINNLGFTIKNIKEKELEQVKETLQAKIVDKAALNEEKVTEASTLASNRIRLSELKRKEGSLQSKIEYFDKVEDRFNRSFNEKLARNISGFYFDEDLINFDKNKVDKSLELQKRLQGLGEEVQKASEELRKNESEKIKNIESKAKIENNLQNEKERLNILDEEIKKYKDWIKYIDFSEDKIFEKDEILSEFDKKITILKGEELSIRKKVDSVTFELDKLKSGKVLELPKEVEEKLKNRDISIKYGMDWLKQNGLTYDQNAKIVERNPFIPYSLIMNQKDIETLDKEPLDVFTSSPICIINRNDLEKGILDEKNGIISFKGVNFFISFNNKLLNEEELSKLIASKEKDVEAYSKILSDKIEAINIYERKRTAIYYSPLSKEMYTEVEALIISLEEEFKLLRDKELQLEKEIGSLKEKVKSMEEAIKNVQNAIKSNNDVIKAFKELHNEYALYKTSKAALEEIIEKLKITNLAISNGENAITKLENDITVTIEAINKYISEEEKLKSDLARFSIYSNGEVINKDIEDLLAEYEALDKEILGSEKDLKQKIAQANIKFIDVENELNYKNDKYGLTEADYINEVFNLQKEQELKDLIKEEESTNKKLQEKEHKIEIEIEKIKVELKDLYDRLFKQFNQTKPKSKELLFDKNFNEEIAMLKVKIKDNELYKKQVNKDAQEINQNLKSLSEFEDFSLVEKEEIHIKVEDLNGTIGKTKRDLNNLKEKQRKYENKLITIIMEIENRDEFKNESLFKEPLATLKGLAIKPVDFKAQLELILETYKLLMEKLLADIGLIEKEENKILESLLEYIEEIHNNIEKIHDNSSITIAGKRLKMLNISVDSFDENKELYKLKLREYIETIRERSLKELEKNNSIEDIISNRVNSFKLYDEVVGISNVDIKLYKIEEDKQKKITWDEVSKNSGGEGFLSAFVILSSLLSYMRKDESDIFSNKEGGKVLIMDNPFAQTNSAHLLKPLMDIAKKSNTQLICLTGLSGDSIYNRFDNIYVLNLISSSLKTGVKYIKSDHIKGEEEKDTEVLVSSRFKIEDQMRLF